eukprot:5455308-Prymnesium_polylepis.1
MAQTLTFGGLALSSYAQTLGEVGAASGDTLTLALASVTVRSVVVSLPSSLQPVHGATLALA